MKMMNNKVLVALFKTNETTKAGIILPENDKERVVKALVVSVADDCDYHLVEQDVIIVDKYKLIKFQYEDKEYYICDSDDIYGIVEEF